MENYNAFILASHAKDRSAYYDILKSVRQEEMVRVKRGVYTTPEQLANTMVDIDAIVPGGILCNISAWNAQDLTISLPQAYHIAVKRGRKIVLPSYPEIILHRITDSIFDIGVEDKIINGYKVKIYNRERCVCDAVKFRNKVGMDVCSEVINTYLSLPDRNLSLLMDYAERLRVKNILEQYIVIKL